MFLTENNNNPEEYLSPIKYADHRFVTKGYIGWLVKGGRLNLINGKLNVEMSDAELDNKSNNNKASICCNEKALHEKEKPELEELDLNTKNNKVLEVGQIRITKIKNFTQFDQNF